MDRTLYAGNEAKKVKPLRRPRHLTSSNATQYIDIPSVWSVRREQLLNITPETFLTKGKQLNRELQQVIKNNQEDAYTVIHLIYERAVKDIYAYPIAALLFEALGQGEDGINCEQVFAALQSELQKSLSALNSKVIRMEELSGVHVGIIFLLYLLLKLENLRADSGTFFKDLLTKLFDTFFPYALGAGQVLKNSINDCVISAICLLFQVAYEEKSSAKERQKIEQGLDFLRWCFMNKNIKVLGRLQILYTLECVNCQRTDAKFKYKTYYQEQYGINCKKEQCLLDSVSSIFCNLKEKPPTLSKSKEDLHSSDESDVFVDPSRKTIHSNSDSFDSSSFDNLGYTPDDTNHRKFSDASSQNGSKFRSEKELATSQSSWEQSVYSQHQTQAKKNLVEQFSLSTDQSNFEDRGDDGRTIATKNEITETLLIPTECIPRILGYEGGIHQKLEFQSNAKIDIDSMGQHVGPRPVTSSITAHRLVAGALGVSPKMEEMKLQLEKEKLEVAREMAVRYKMSTRQREVKLSGSAEAVSTARRLIDEIVNYTTTLEVDLPGFTMDAILDAAGVKLETIETLLNVIFKLEEQEDEKVILYISGDKSSCEDAKALVFEQLGSLKFSPGLLVRMPLSLSSILTSQEKANSFTNKMTELCGASVRPLKFQDQFCFFLHGSSSKTCQAEDLLNKVNTELVFNRNQWEKVFESENDDESDFSLTLDYLLILMDEIAHGDPKKFTESIVEESTPMISYTRDVLLQCRNSSHAKRLPLELRIILQAEGHCDFIVDTEFSPTRSFSTDSHELNFLDQS